MGNNYCGYELSQRGLSGVLGWCVRRKSVVGLPSGALTIIPYYARNNCCDNNDITYLYNSRPRIVIGIITAVTVAAVVQARAQRRLIALKGFYYFSPCEIRNDNDNGNINNNNIIIWVM